MLIKKQNRNFSTQHRLLVEKINKEVAEYSQIVSKEMILIGSNDKPFPRAAKGTVNKAASMKLYEKEIGEV
jgi:hypothetical protein